MFERLDRHAPGTPTPVLLQDDLASEPDAVWAETCSFLDLAPIRSLPSWSV